MPGWGVSTVLAATAGAEPGRPALRAFVAATLATVAEDEHLYVYVTSGSGGDGGPDRMLYLAGRSAAQHALKVVGLDRLRRTQRGHHRHTVNPRDRCVMETSVSPSDNPEMA